MVSPVFMTFGGGYWEGSDEFRYAAGLAHPFRYAAFHGFLPEHVDQCLPPFSHLYFSSICCLNAYQRSFVV